MIGIDRYNYNGHPSHWEETLAQLAAIIKGVNPTARVFFYRQSELVWINSVGIIESQKCEIILLIII